MSHIVHHFIPVLFWIVLWIIGIVSVLYIYWTIDEIHANYITNKEILSILEKPQTCNLPYWIENDIRTMANTLDTSTSCTDK